jgi:hypothetical protein
MTQKSVKGSLIFREMACLGRHGCFMAPKMRILSGASSRSKESLRVADGVCITSHIARISDD